MIVAKLLRELDAELERLQTARNTIVALIHPVALPRKAVKPPAVAGTPEPAAALAEVEAPQEPRAEAAAAVKMQVVPPPRRGRPKGSRNRFPATQRNSAARTPEPTALTRAVSSGPVFVSAAELDRQRKQPVVMASPKLADAVPPEGTLEALVREVAARRAEAAA